MNQILELREKRAKAWEAAKAFLDTKRGADGLISAEDSATYDKMEADVVNLGKEIERLEKQATIDAELAKPTSSPLTSLPGNTHRAARRKTGRASDAYKKAFWDSIRKKNYYDVTDALAVGTDTEGGYLVPDEFEKTLVCRLCRIRTSFAPLPPSSRPPAASVRFPSSPVMARQRGWTRAVCIRRATTHSVRLLSARYKLGTAIKVSEELINDSVFDLESYIAAEFARRVGTKEEEAFITGNGTGKPTGVFTSAESAVTTTGTAITFDDVMDLYHSLRQRLPQQVRMDSE
jgi:HK97 family phage major capsid protein